MQIIRWQDATKPQEQELRNRMQQQGLSPYSWSNGPYDTYAVHSHSYEKVLYCVRGAIRFVLPDQPESERNIDLAPGDCIVVEDAPAGIRAGKAAGARVLALRTTAPDPELNQSGADWIVNDLASLRLDSSDYQTQLELILAYP